MAAADLATGAPGQVRDEQGGMPLHRAAYMGHIELVDVRARHDAPLAQTGLGILPRSRRGVGFTPCSDAVHDVPSCHARCHQR